MENNEPQDELPMNWYNFYYRFRLPLGIALNTLCIINNFLAKSFLGFMIYVLYVMYLVFLYNVMKYRKVDGFRYIILEFVIGIVIVILTAEVNNSIEYIGMLIGLALWYVPNYIYFEKRKGVFVNKGEDEIE